MISAVEFQRTFEELCDRLARDRYDQSVFEVMHSPEFMLSCAWMGLDPDHVRRRIKEVACEREKLAAAR